MNYAIAVLNRAIIIERNYISGCEDDIKFFSKNTRKVTELENDIAGANERIKEFERAISILNKSNSNHEG